ncbi:hypothetical protein ACHAWO_009767 [Cyclotella atomus]|uniref:Galactose oxidase n=1 Tax=Cyclotella atomus TaxID=382360 RepID=A0ABD3QDB7_9STRA
MMMKISASFFIACLQQSANALTKTSTSSYGYQRKAPHDRKFDGTQNWELLKQGTKHFTPRHSHATTIFKCPNSPSEQCLWLTGGFSEPHRTWDLEIENENADAWWSQDGETWHQVTDLDGDFLRGVGNWDAKPGSHVAPWYSRYGHSLDALDGDADGSADVMVLAGGNSPMPSNDVWISRNGRYWNYDGKAPWSARAYHASVVYKKKLWILGGTPLSNDVWVGSLVKDPTRDAGYTMEWSKEKEAPWTSRAGMCAVSQQRNVNATDGVAQVEYLYVIGGFAQTNDGIHTENDVWKWDGSTWKEIQPANNATSMPWRGRAFHGCATWNSLTNRARWVADDSSMHLNIGNLSDDSTAPRIFITGGGYMGTKGNNEVRSFEAYSDTWWSSDGSTWYRVNYEEGSRYKDNIYSTNEWTETTVDGKKTYRGKWGHTLEAFHATQDIDLDEKIATTNVSLNICTVSDSSACKRISVVESRIPTLFTIGGKSENGPMVNDVFASRQGSELILINTA